MKVSIFCEVAIVICVVFKKRTCELIGGLAVRLDVFTGVIFRCVCVLVRLADSLKKC